MLSMYGATLTKFVQIQVIENFSMVHGNAQIKSWQCIYFICAIAAFKIHVQMWAYIYRKFLSSSFSILFKDGYLQGFLFCEIIFTIILTYGLKCKNTFGGPEKEN